MSFFSSKSNYIFLTNRLHLPKSDLTPVLVRSNFGLSPLEIGFARIY